MPVVKMPDGALVDMPDNPTPEQLEGLRKLQGQSGVLDTAKRWVGDVGRAFLQSPTVQALQGVVAANPANLVVNKVLPQKQAPLTAQQVVEKLPARQEGYGTAAREGLGGFLSNPVGGIPAAVAEIAGNVGGEASAKLFGEGPLQRAGGALLTGGLTAAGMNRIGRLAPNVKDLAKESLEGVEPGQLELAKALMDRSQQQGVSMDLAQALSAIGARSGNMTTVRNVLANNKAGDRVQTTLRAQPSELSVLADTTIARMPGRVYSEGQAANNLQQVATHRLQQEKDVGSALWKATLEKGRAALAATKTAEVRKAVEGSRVATAAQKNLQQEVNSLTRQLQLSRADDAAAVAARNAAVQKIEDQLKVLESFTLPRGKSSTNRGSLLELPKRGESIDFDQIAREVQAERLRQGMPPRVEQADSSQSLLYKGKLQQAQEGLTTAQRTSAEASQALKNAQEGRRAVTQVPAEVMRQEIARLQSVASQTPRTPIAKSLQALAKDLDGITDANQVNEILKAAIAKTKTVNLETPGIDAYVAKRVQAEIAKVRERLGETFSPIREANTRLRAHYEDSYNPLKQGLVGQIAGKGYADDVQASTAKVKQIFEQGVDPQGPSPVRVLAKELAKVDKEAFADAAKTHYSGKVAEAFDPVIAGAPATNSDAAKRIWDSMFKNTKQYQGAKDTVASIAEAYGQNPAQAVKGLENFAQITKALTNTTKVGGLAREEIFRLGGKNYGADALRVFGFLPFERAARRLEDRTMYNAFADFDKILTTPEGVDLLIKLSKQPAMSKEALALIGVGQGAAVSAQTGANSPDVNRK